LNNLGTALYASLAPLARGANAIVGSIVNGDASPESMSFQSDTA
jgi:hypothetical protein